MKVKPPLSAPRVRAFCGRSRYPRPRSRETVSRLLTAPHKSNVGRCHMAASIGSIEHGVREILYEAGRPKRFTDASDRRTS
jgi:hypothetical protein